MFTQLEEETAFFKTLSSLSLHMYILVRYDEVFLVLLNPFLLMMDELPWDTWKLISFSRQGSGKSV